MPMMPAVLSSVQSTALPTSFSTKPSDPSLSAFRLAISVLISAYGTHDAMDQAMPSVATMTVAAGAVYTKQVSNISAANKQWASCQTRPSDSVHTVTDGT